MMNNKLTKRSLIEINHQAKNYGELKKEAYQNKQFRDCGIYKTSEQRLYALKALSLISAEEFGLVHRENPQIDGNNTILECLILDGSRFHSISQFQDPDHPDYEKYENWTSRKKRPYHGEFERYLIKNLSHDLRELWNVICEERKIPFRACDYLESEGALKKCIEKYKGKLEYIKYTYDDPDDNDDFLCGMDLDLFLSGIKVCRINIAFYDRFDRNSFGMDFLGYEDEFKW